MAGPGRSGSLAVDDDLGLVRRAGRRHRAMTTVTVAGLRVLDDHGVRLGLTCDDWSFAVGRPHPRVDGVPVRS